MSANVGAPVTKTLIAVCCGVYVIELVGRGQFENVVVFLFGLNPHDVVQSLFLWQPVTYLFLHGNWLHLGTNMWCLWEVGPDLEKVWGPERFLAYFLLTGVGTGLFLILLDPIKPFTTIGCSGSLIGLVLAQYVLFGINAHYLLILGAISFVGAFAIPNSTFSNAANLGGLLFAYLALRQEGLPFGLRSDSRPPESRWSSRWPYQQSYK